MSKLLRSFYHNLKEPIIIFDLGEDAFYQNRAFKKTFGNFDGKGGREALKKLNYKFHFDVCMLQTEDFMTYTPITAAIESRLNFSSFAMYQADEQKFSYFIIKSFSIKKYKVVYFYDVTQELELERLKKENEKLTVQNLEFAKTNSKAQNQAVKMALLNRIANSIRETIDIKSLLSVALRELSIIFGAQKVYFAKEKSDHFVIEHIYPHNAGQIGEEVFYDKKLMQNIKENKNSVNVCIKEHEKSQKPLKSPMNRIIMPVTKLGGAKGAVVIFTPKKNISDIEKELLVGISMQISGAILQATLFSQVSEKKEALEGAIKELKETQLQLINAEKMASLGQLIASVAHEINTPLASISANNEMMKKIFAQSDDKNKNLLEEINSIDSEAIKRIANLVQSLKRFVRLDEMTLQKANINQELDLTLKLLKHKTKNNINIIKNYSQLPPISCYPNMLNQVFLNILMNSIQSIEKAENGGEITVTTKIQDNNLVVSISDNGPGIEEKNKEKIFQPGFTTKKIGEGTGLGLAICKKIIEKHKGEINFSSVRKKETLNTVFTIKIPILL